MLSDIMTDHGDCRHCEARRRIRQSVRRLANRSWANLHVVARSDAKPAPAFAHRATARRFHGEWIAARSEARLRLLKPLNLETTMLLDHPSDEPTAIRTHIGAIFVSLELSRSNWLVTSLSPGKGEKMSKYRVAAGAPRRTGSTARRCCGRFSPTSAASRGSARWWSRPRLRRRIGGGFVANGRR